MSGVDNTAPDQGDGQHDDDAHSIAGSEKSTSSVRSGIPKLSGLKPPTKVGRPCAGQQAKPALPATPTKNSSYDHVKQTTEDSSRYKLTDVQEMEEYEEDFFGNRLHTFSSPHRNRYNSSSSSYDFDEPDFFRRFLNLEQMRRSSFSPSYSPPRYDYDSLFREYDDIFRRLSVENTLNRSRYAPQNLPTNDRPKDDFFGDYFSPSRRVRRSSIGSTGTSSSMDALWDLHPRRLSEAGLSRHSDNSAVLTEDTDSFIIGQRVWVGGTKPGQIAYIGETQFAPGEWAGIVLDQPIGKNDGSVGGVRYFQCEAKKGVFSRLTRLTRYPMSGETGAGDSFSCTTPSPTNGMRKSPMSPTASNRSVLSISNTSLASAHVDYKIGDRVIIKSSQGSKIGTLRYMGFTSFANGEWCGVELDDPRGKNDGSVEGKRYFECRPNYGLFAPVAKVSKSPSNRKPGGGCVVHPGASSNRRGSRESLVSMTSSLASASTAARRRTPPKPPSTSTPMPSRTALQDVLKEKQQHIEQLLKERDLERSEITRAAIQADEAEQKHASLKQEFEKYRSECDIRLKEYTSLVERLKVEHDEVLSQLDDEKRKNEDLQFKFEEAAITKGDIEVANESNISRIADLETEVGLMKTQVEEEASKLFQTNEDLIRSREEMESLKVELEHANEKRSSLENDELKSIELVQQLQNQLEESNAALKLHQADSCKQIESLNVQLAKQTSDYEIATFKTTKDLEDANSKYTADIGAKIMELEAAMKELSNAKDQLEFTNKDLEKTKYDTTIAEAAYKKELDKLRMDFSARVLEVETRNETISSKSTQIEKLETELTATKLQTENLQKEVDTHKKLLTESEGDLQQEIAAIKKQLGKTNDELKTLTATKIDLEKQLVATRCSNDEKLATTQTDLKLQEEKLTLKLSELEEASGAIKKLQAELKEKDFEIERHAQKSTDLTNKLEQETSQLESSKTSVARLELELGDANRKLQMGENKYQELSQQKLKLETELQQLYGSSGEESAKLEILNNEVRLKEAEISDVKEDCALKVQFAEHALQQGEIALQTANEKAAKDINELQLSIVELEKRYKSDLVNEIERKNAEVVLIKGECDKKLQQMELVLQTAAEKSSKDINEFTLKIVELEKLHADGLNHEVGRKETEILKIKQDCDQKVKDVEIALQTATQKSSDDLNELNLKICDLEKSGKSYEINLMELQKLLATKEDELKKLLGDCDEQSKSSNDLSQKVVVLENTIHEKEAKLLEITQSLTDAKKLLEDKDNNLTKALDDLKTAEDNKLKLLENNCTETDKVNLLTNELESNKLQLSNIQTELTRATQDVVMLQTANDETKTALADREGTIVKLQAEIAQNAEKEQLIATLKSECEKAGIAIADLNNKRDQLMESAKLEATQLKTRVDDLQSELAVANKKSSELQSLLDASKNDVNSNLVDSASKGREIETLRADLQAALAELNLLKSEKVAVESHNVDSLKKCEELSNRILKLSQDAKETEKIFEVERGSYVQLLKVLRLTKRQKLELSKEGGLGALLEQVQVVETDEVADLQMRVNQATDALQKAGENAKKLEAEVVKLRNELVKVQKEKVLDTQKVQPIEASIVNNNTVSNDYKQLLEEKELAETQVQFLNSIIVDMQKKNEEQKVRIEILESGYSPAAADELKLMGLIERKPAPRKYCDICEEFDLHETEDCPLQAAEDMPASPREERSNASKPPPRPYCDICEMFGHSTEDCQDDQTY